MKRVLLTAFLLPLIASSVCAQNGRWKRYTVKGENFSVTLPTLPAMSTYKHLVERMSKERRQRALGAYAAGLVYTIACFENSEPRESLDSFIDAEIFTHNGWDRASEQELKHNGFSGKQYLSPNKVPGTMQIYSTGNAIYQFQVFGAPADDPRVKQYFASVVLGKKVTGIEVSDGTGVPYVPDEEAKAQIIDLNNAKLLVGKDVDRKPVLVMKPEPAYTEEARQNAIEGQVILKVVFSSDGSVTSIRTASGLPDGLTEKAIEAARKIKFIPALKDGKFVSMWMQLEYHFNLY